jgi:MFS family permease
MTATPAATQPNAPISPFAEPKRAVTGGWIAAFAAAWLGIWMAQLTPIQLLLPVQVDTVRGETGDWLDSVVAFGIISGIAGVCAIVAYPLAGALSDRTTSRFGRRRPWILGGALAFAISLVVLGFQTTFVGVGIWWALALTGFCVLTAALTATISDQVPVRQRGFVSGWVSAPQAVGTILGLLLVTMVIVGQVVGYIALAVLLLVLVARDPRDVGLAPQAPGLRVDARQPHPDQPRQRARNDAPVLLPAGRPQARRPRGRPHHPDARVHGVRGARVPVPRASQRRDGAP